MTWPPPEPVEGGLVLRGAVIAALVTCVLVVVIVGIVTMLRWAF